MKKKIINTFLVSLMIAGTTSFSAFATTANGSVVIGDKTFDLAYANDATNLTEINNAIIQGGAIYVKDFSGDWIDNTTGKTVEESVISGETSTGAISDNTDITSKFTDTNFKTAVYGLIGKTSPDPILYSDVKSITDVSLDNEEIGSLSGIEYFTELKTLVCDANLTSLDVSKNTELVFLSCVDNQLTSLDVSKNTELINLFCAGNQLTSLDVSNNETLTNLNCYSNQLTSLDVSKNAALTVLGCGDNQLTSLEVSKNEALTALYCEGNQLTILDVSKNTSLGDLNCDNNTALIGLDSDRTAITHV
ncbi:leucine-rich repeat domain-containing protein [Clostridium estertheticum]|uniref:Leucine-rich repeat domain-containing protein n=1 Tax=Clostridium estertheticum TaxID=238834 RepID=A0A7Y3SWB8_9CLOT|nr:hypothetical protein [Clostridium estertheticum]NNU76565.1 hypothetical protein [Clostridium estertheticum]WBL49709.1 hypothetical protein LOR37_23415 [Clostridium estertheticum]